MTDLIYTRGAIQEISAIREHTCKRWGEAQADRYIEAIETCCEEIARKEAAVRFLEKPNHHVGYHRCERHYIFFLRESVQTTIIAVLHEKMDLLARLRARLKA